MIQITQQDKERIYRLNQDKETIEALKKVFLIVFLAKDVGQGSNDVNVLAASRLALQFLEEGFKNLERITPEKKEDMSEQNFI